MNRNTLAIAQLIFGLNSAVIGGAAQAATTLAADGSGAAGSKPSHVVPETVKEALSFDRAGLQAQLAASLPRTREQAAAVGREIASRALAEPSAGPARPTPSQLERPSRESQESRASRISDSAAPPAANPLSTRARPSALGAPERPGDINSIEGEST